MAELKPIESCFEVLDHVPIGSLVLREDFVVVYWNRCLEDWTGFSRDQILGNSLWHSFPELKKPKYIKRIETVFEGGPPTVFSSQLHKFFIPYTRGDGQQSIQHTTVTPIPVEDGKSFFALFSVQDVTDLNHRIRQYREMHDKALKEIEERLKVEKALKKRDRQQDIANRIGALCLRTEDLQELMDQSVVLIAETLGVELCKVLLLDEFGDFLNLVAGVGWKKGLIGQGKIPTKKEIQTGYTLMVNRPVVVKDLRKEKRFNGSSFLLDHGVVSGLSVPMISRGKTIGVLGTHSTRHHLFTKEDVAFVQSVSNLIAVAIERKRAEESLEEKSIRDSLTHLYNRRHFRERLKEEIIRANRDQESFAILLCDLDRFKAINDKHGHIIGDKVLKGVANAIQDSTRGTDLVFRWGDEKNQNARKAIPQTGMVFRWGGDEMVVLLSKPTKEGILKAADRIRGKVQKVGRYVGLDLDLTIGVSIFPEHGANEDELIRLADRALYIGKKQGTKAHIGIEDYKLEKDSIKVVFQPVVDIKSQKTLGYEALSRDPQGGLSFANMARKYNAIGQLQQFKQLCLTSQIEEAKRVNLERVFINIDFDILNGMEVIPKVSHMQVILEISELEALKDLSQRLSIASKWRGLGYQFAIDDFGAGFLSLPFIAQLIPEYVKIDRSTILQAVSSVKFKGFLVPLIQALKELVSEGIVAEGVEEEKELEVVKEIGISLVQGYLTGKPGALG